LTVLTNLDASLGRLAEKHEGVIAHFIDLPCREIEAKLEAWLNLVPNAWQAVEARLKASQIL
jgi:hypothetical protein